MTLELVPRTLSIFLNRVPTFHVNQGVHSKAMRQHRANKQDSATTVAKAVGKVGVNKYNRLRDGKENATSQRSNTRAGGIVQVQKVTKQIAPPKSDRTGLIVPKVHKPVI